MGCTVYIQEDVQYIKTGDVHYTETGGVQYTLYIQGMYIIHKQGMYIIHKQGGVHYTYRDVQYTNRDCTVYIQGMYSIHKQGMYSIHKRDVQYTQMGCTVYKQEDVQYIQTGDVHYTQTGGVQYTYRGCTVYTNRDAQYTVYTQRVCSMTHKMGMLCCFALFYFILYVLIGHCQLVCVDCQYPSGLIQKHWGNQITAWAPLNN